MCETNNINQIIVKPLFKDGRGFAIVYWMMKRSDNMIFSYSSEKLLEVDALRLWEELNSMEEHRTCDCKKGFTCNKHLKFVQSLDK